MTDTTPRRISWRAAFNRVGYTPHDVQAMIHRARAGAVTGTGQLDLSQPQARFRVVSAGRRTGKSTSGGHELYVRHLEAGARQAELNPKGRRDEFWIVGPEYSDAEKEFRVVYNDLVKAGAQFDKPGTYDDVGGGNMHISLFGGRFLIAAQSAKYPQNLVGEALKGVIMAEAAKMKPMVWPKYIRPMLADYARDTIPSWALFNSTPEGQNWFYDLYMRGISTDVEDAAWWGCRMPSWSNNILFPGGRQDPEILEMARDMSEEKFKQEIGAEFTEFVGRVFKRFDEETHVGDYPYDPRWPLAIATDYGYRNPNVLLFVQWDIWDNVWVVAEYYKREETTEELVRSVLEDPILAPLARAATLLYPDPEDPGASAHLADKFRVSIQGGTGGLLADRLDLIRRWLKVPEELEHLEEGHPERLPKLHFNQRLTPHTVREMAAYRYADTVDESKGQPKENPMKVDDHAPEALGRFFAGRYGQVASAKGHARQSRATVRTGQSATRQYKYQ